MNIGHISTVNVNGIFALALGCGWVIIAGQVSAPARTSVWNEHQMAEGLKMIIWQYCWLISVDLKRCDGHTFPICNWPRNTVMNSVMDIKLIGPSSHHHNLCSDGQIFERK